MRWACEKLEGFWRIIVADVFLFVSFVGTVNGKKFELAFEAIFTGFLMLLLQFGEESGRCWIAISCQVNLESLSLSVLSEVNVCFKLTKNSF